MLEELPPVLAVDIIDAQEQLVLNPTVKIAGPFDQLLTVDVVDVLGPDGPLHDLGPSGFERTLRANDDRPPLHLHARVLRAISEVGQQQFEVVAMRQHTPHVVQELARVALDQPQLRPAVHVDQQPAPVFNDAIGMLGPKAHGVNGRDPEMLAIPQRVPRRGNDFFAVF